MTIEDDSIIDAAGIDEKSGQVHLSMFAPSPWERTSLLQLESKINRYLGFIESGELAAAYPTSVDRKVVIDVYCRFRPDEQAVRLLQQAASVCDEYGALLRHLHIGRGYVDDEA